MAQDDNNLDLVNDTQSGNNRTGGNDAEKAVSQMARKKLLDKLGDVGKKAVAKIGATKFGMKVSAIFAKITAALPHLAIVAIIVICAIGLIAFFINIPGLIRGNLSINFVGKLKGVLYGDNLSLTGEGISKKDRIELLQYVTDMGIDVEGFGFAPNVEYEVDENGNETNKIKDYSTSLMGSYDMDGNLKSDESSAKNPKGDLLYYYLMANERAFVKNDDGILGTFFGKSDWFGMIDLYSDAWLDGIETSIDRENMLLKISVNNARAGELLSEDQYAFSLEEWTGRYGLPVEFSLALHLATMSSGMVEELITHEDLQTMVTVALHETECKISFKFRIKQEDGSVKEIDIPFKAPGGDIENLTRKLQNGEEIEKDDVSIEGLYKAITDLTLYDYEIATVEYDDIYNDTYCGYDEKRTLNKVARHIETIEAMLGNTDIAVYIASKTGKEELFVDDLGFPVVFKKYDTTKHTYTLNSGAFICKYDENGKPDENSGKLKGISLVDSVIDTIDTSYEVTEETDLYYVYRMNTKATTEGENAVGGELAKSDYEEVVPKTEEDAIYYADDGTQKNILNYSQRIKGLQYYLSKDAPGSGTQNEFGIADIVAIKAKTDGYEAMFKEIDWFMSYALWRRADWDKTKYNYTCDSNIQNEFFYGESTTKNLNDILYYTIKFKELNAASYSPQEYYNALTELYNELNQDLTQITTDAKTTVDIEERIESILENWGYPGLSGEVIREIYGKYQQTDDVNNETVKYVQPYILSVVKHWYKDVDFTSAYSYSKDTVELIYTADTNLPNTVEVVTILDPIGNSGTIPSQPSEPYVIKGDLVLCDGEVQDMKSEDLNNVSAAAPNVGSGYNWGDGYRATKKILTQGYYYTFDGTHETSRSIYFQEEIEKGKDTAFEFRVDNGRIIGANELEKDESIGLINLKKNEIIDNNGNLQLTAIYKGVKEVYNANGIKVFFIGQSSKNIDFYVINIEGNKMKYLSPADDNTYETVQKRVQIINEVWDSAGVVCKRVPLSFDNVVQNTDDSEDSDGSADGQIMSITGLSILKNSSSKDAEFIYRDLKEMLIELGYYTQAEFDYLDTDVLTWFIPEYNPTTWPQNSGKSEFFAALYPKEETEDSSKADSTDDTTDTSEEEDKEQTLEEMLSFDKTQGFDPDLDVIAPGDCIIINKTDEGIEIEFDGVSQPEIGILDGYTMIIKGINTESGVITYINENEEEVQISYEDAIENETVIKVGSVLGKTGTEVIEVHLMSDNGGILSNVEDYMAPSISTVNSSSTEFSVTGTVLTEEEFTNCCLSYMNSNGIVNSDFSESNLREFYRVCKKNAVNPEYAFVTAISESGLTAGEATSTHNYWGLDTPNGSSVPCLGTMLETLQIYCERLVEYQDPTSSYYSMITQRYEERSTCTENGGCNPNGYGKPNTLQGLQSIYSYVGDHVTGSAGTGGYYYLDPAVAGITAIYSTHEEFVSKCQNVHTYGTPTSVWEQAQYTAYQVEMKIEKARSIFGDKAGRYML